MATVDKAFRIKNGLVVEGTSATVNGSNVLTEASTSTFTNKTFDTGDAGNTFQIQNNTISSYAGSGNTVVLNTSPTISSLYVNNGLYINGATTGQTQIVAANTASGVLTLPSATGTVALTSDIPSLTGYVTESGVQTLTNKTLTSPVINGNGVVFEGSTENEFETTLTVTDPTADHTITLPNVTGTVITTGDTGTVTNTMLAGSIGNDKLSNSSVTVNGTSISLGSSQTITAATPNALTIGTGLSGTSFNGSSAVTVAIDSTVATTSGSQTLTNKTISSTSNTISVSSGNVTDFAEASVDAVAAAIAAGTQTNISITYNDEAGTLSFNASGGVSSLAGTENEVTVSASTGAVTIGLPDNVTIAGNVTINGTPTNSTHAATVGYVDAVAQGLHIHASCVTATTNNIDLSTDLEAGDMIDGVTLVAGNRVLVKNQSTTSQNGIYLAVTSGAAVRASDFDTSAEIQGGDFVFITGGTQNDNTGWVQTEKVTTLGVDPIVFQQFSGAGTYNAGNGLTLTGNVFSINTGITADLSTTQTLTNKTLTSPVLTTPSISGLLVLDNNIVIEGTNDTHETTLTFTDPTQDNTITFKDATGTVAFTSDIETAIDGFGNAVTSTTGISVSYASTSNILTIGNTGVTSIAGTADQVSANTSTGSVTLSLPQSIASTSSPTFAGLSVGSGSLTAGSIILTDALIGTATTSLSGTSATVVDSWSATNYKSAKYIVQMRDGNDIEVLEVLVTIDGNNNVYLTEYADIQSNAQIGTTDADYDSGNVRLKVTATGTTTVKVHKTLIEA
jgi:hypothetical protein